VSFPQWALFAYAGAALFFAVGALVGKDKIRTLFGNILLGLLTLFVAHFLTVAVTSKKLGTSNPAVAVETAEMQLRLVACYDSLRRHTMKDASSVIGKTFGPPKGGAETEEKQRTEAFDSNEKALVEALKANPENIKYRTKLIVILEEKKEEARVKPLLAEMRERCSLEDDRCQMASVLTHIYLNKEVEAKEVKPFQETLDKTLSPGWFRDRVTERLLAAAKETKRLDEFQDEVDTRNILTLGKFVALIVLIGGAAIVGVVNIFIQLAMLGRSAQPKIDDVGLDVPWKTILAVFIGWFAIQILLSAFMVQVIGVKTLKQPDVVALTTTLTYLIGNAPGLILIYFIALKPKGASFKESLRLRARTSTSGPIKVIFSGYLAACSAVPLVIGTAWIAHQFLGVNSSDNQVIAQFIQAASGANPLAVILFFFTIGVMAPFFEEILFRGFLYGSLKTKIGAPLAMLISAAIFASVHFDKGGALMLFAIGFVLAFTYERTRSLYASMIAHGLWNTTACLVMFALFSS
jgi:membrane protease YdiL (CAAX protease family)